MQVSDALAYSRYSPQAAAAVLTHQLEFTKLAGGGIFASLQNPVHANGTPNVTAETLRNALIGLGAGGIAGGVSELNRPEKERNYSKILDKAMLGGMLGGGGTLAWRHLVNSGNAAAPAVFQEDFNGLGAQPSKLDALRERVHATGEQADAAADTSPNVVKSLGYGIANDPNVPGSVQRTALSIADTTMPQGVMSAIGGAVGLYAGSRAGGIGRHWINMPKGTPKITPDAVKAVAAKGAPLPAVGKRTGILKFILPRLIGTLAGAAAGHQSYEGLVPGRGDAKQ